MSGLTIVNARVWTGDLRQPWADAIAAADGRIAFVGSSADARKRAGRQDVIDAERRLVLPGFIDAHVHFLEGGHGLASVQLRDVASRAAFAARVAEFASRQGRKVWITRGDWDHHNWGGTLPTREWIDAAAGDHPVWVTRLDAHMGLANSVALRQAGIDRSTPDVDGGEIVRDEAGNPTGILKDNAQALVQRIIPVADADADLSAAMRAVAAQGVTSIHHMGTWDDLAVFRRAHGRGALRTRIYAAVPIHSWQRLLDDVRTHGRGDEWLRTGALKGFADGSLGSHTAAMYDGYADDPDNRGLFVNDLEDLLSWALEADRSGLHVLMHAIGDRAVHEQLNIFQRVRGEVGPRDRRFRVEHAQHVRLADVARFSELEVIASMQPYHAIDDGRWAERVIGPSRMDQAFPIGDLVASGARVAFGSDWPVAPPSPLAAIDAAVRRRTLDGLHPDGWVPRQRVTLDAALRAHTAAAAFASFEEAIKGTLSVGKLADLVMLDRDITSAAQSILDAKVVMTVVGGSVVYPEPAGAAPLKNA